MSDEVILGRPGSGKCSSTGGIIVAVKPEDIARVIEIMRDRETAEWASAKMGAPLAERSKERDDNADLE